MITFQFRDFESGHWVHIIVPSQQKEESTIDFKFPLTFDFSGSSSSSLNFKSVDDSGILTELSVSNKKASPKMSYVGTPANIESLSTLGSFVKPEASMEAEEEAEAIEETSSSGGLSKTSLIIIIACACLLVLFIIFIAIARRKKDKPAKVVPIVPNDA